MQYGDDKLICSTVLLIVTVEIKDLIEKLDNSVWPRGNMANYNFAAKTLKLNAGLFYSLMREKGYMLGESPSNQGLLDQIRSFRYGFSKSKR